MIIANNVVQDVQLERYAQSVQWGGIAHDDEQGPQAWCDYIEKQLTAARAAFPKPHLEGSGPEWRTRMVKIAALAIAGMETYDRHVAETEAIEKDH